MPTVFRLGGFRFMIFQGDAEHAPPHVHVIRDRSEVVICLEPVAVREVHSMKRADVRAAVRIVEANLALLIAAWKEIHG